MRTALTIAAVGLGLAAAYRLYKAAKYGVPFGRALLQPFVPIGALQVPGSTAAVASHVLTARVTTGASSF